MVEDLANGRRVDSRVAQRIRELIVEGTLTPGTRVAEAAIAERLGVSRTPVRNALPALASEGLLQPAGKRGYAVRNFTTEDSYRATDWAVSRKKVPRPDYLSSSRKRLAPQLIFKGGILKTWGRKQAVAVHSAGRPALGGSAVQLDSPVFADSSTGQFERQQQCA